jgi:hypothetical protein
MKTSLLALASAFTLLAASTVSAEKTDLVFEKQANGTFCGTWYKNNFSDRMAYSCKTRTQWEKLGVNFHGQ